MRRRLTPDLFRAIVRRHLPRGWRVAERPEGIVELGSCHFRRKTVFVPPLVDRAALCIALHECAHARLHSGPDMTPHVEEYEAEQLAIALIRLEGLSVPRRVVRDARKRVQHAIAADEVKGWWIDPVIRRWAGVRKAGA